MTITSRLFKKTFKTAAAAAVGGIALLSFPIGAHASSEGRVTSGCVPGTNYGEATFDAYAANAFIRNIRFVLIFNGVETTVGTVTNPNASDADPPPPPPGYIGSVTATDLAPGDYIWDWYDTTGAPGENGPHRPPNGNDAWRGIGYFSFTIPPCVDETTTTTTIPETTTTVAGTTTTVAQTTTTPAPPTTAPGATTTTIVANPPTTAPPVATSIVANPPSTAPAATTAPPQTTAASANTLPSTGANSGTMLGLGAAFLVLGGGALAGARRRPATNR